MTLDNLARLHANRTHETTKKSLTKSRERLKGTQMFQSTTLDDNVRKIKEVYCCKRVRSWEYTAKNPLMEYRKASEAARGTNHEKRMHNPALQHAILDIYDVMLQIESKEAVDFNRKDSLPEVIVKHIANRVLTRRAATEQLRALVTSAMYGSATNTRIRTFSSLCGLSTDPFNPPEKAIMFFRLVRKLYRAKRSFAVGRAEDPSIIAVVFHNVGIPRECAKLLIEDIFMSDPLWRFDYLAESCTELKVDRSWPASSSAELLEKAEGPKTAGRNQRFMYADDFFELIINTWVDRGKKIYAALSAATEKEEAEAYKMLHLHVSTGSSGDKQPLTSNEIRFFHELMNEYWNAPIPWATFFNNRNSAFSENRTQEEITRLYSEFIKGYEKNNSIPWAWEDWDWKMEWDWGGILLCEADLIKRKSDQEIQSVTVDLSHFQVGDRMAQRIGQILSTDLAKPKLNTLILIGNDIRGKGCTLVIQGIIKRDITLRVLDISDNLIGIEGANSIATLVSQKHCTLQLLKLENNQLRDRSAKLLLQSIGINTSLKSVSLARNLLSRGEALSHMIRKNSTMEHLDLSWNTLRSPAGVLIALAFVDNYVIEELCVQFNSFGSSGAVALAKALGQNHILRILDLSYNNITYIKKDKLAELMGKTSLTDLILDGNPLERTGVDNFRQYCTLPSLSLEKCHVSSSEELRETW